MDIGAKMKQARQDAEVTQKELAEKLGVHQKDISRWENGERTPALETFAKICRILKVSVDDMLDIDR